MNYSYNTSRYLLGFFILAGITALICSFANAFFLVPALVNLILAMVMSKGIRRPVAVALLTFFLFSQSVGAAKVTVTPDQYGFPLSRAVYLAMSLIEQHVPAQDVQVNVKDFIMENGKVYAIYMHCPNTIDFDNDLATTDTPWVIRVYSFTHELLHTLDKNRVCGGIAPTTAQEKANEDMTDYVAKRLVSHWFGLDLAKFTWGYPIERYNTKLLESKLEKTDERTLMIYYFTLDWDEMVKLDS